MARRGLDRAAWTIGFLFLFVQLFGIVRYQAAAGELTPSPLLWGQLVLAHVAMLGLALAVSRFGLGNGFAMLMGATLLHELRIAGARQYSYLLTEMISMPVVVILVLMLGALAWTVVLLGRAGRNGTGSLPTAVPFPVSSTVGWAGAGALMALPATLSVWMPEAARVAQLFQTSQWLYSGLFLFLAFDLALVFGLLFFRPGIISELWVKWVPGVDPTSVVAAARALLPVGLGLSIGATVGVPMVLMLFGSWTGVPEAATFGMLVLPLTCAIADVVDEWKALRRLGPLISVWEIQRTAEVEPIFHLLRSAGIEAHARSFLFRATQQFFAPWIPVGILVPATREAEARALLATRLPAK